MISKAFIHGMSKSDIVREILRDGTLDVKAVVKELKRLCGKGCADSMVYAIRKELKNAGEFVMNGTLPHHDMGTGGVEEVEPVHLREVELYLKMRDLVKDMGGVETAQRYLDLIKRDVLA